MTFLRTAAVAALTCGLTIAACAGSGSTLPVQTRPSPKAHLGGKGPSRIAMILMENEEYGDIIGSSDTPYINGLAKQFALATRSFAVSHPSLPNYLALTSGSTHGITSDCTGCSVAGSGLAGQLHGKGISWKAYMEDLPHPCFKGAGSAGYAKKHDPFVYYRALAANPSQCGNVVPLPQLQADESANHLPRFVWITPNLCHDMHDCNPATGDRFLAGLVPPLLQALGPTGLLILTWDEGSSDAGCCRFAGGGHIVTILAGPAVRPQARMSTPVDHYSVVQTIEDLFGVRRLGHANCACTPTLQPLLAAH